MGRLRSKSGCLTCRGRRVKCDEVRPMCGQCSTKSRFCQWEPTHTIFRGYRPRGGSSSAAPEERDGDVDGVGEEERDDEEDEERTRGGSSSFNFPTGNRNAGTGIAEFPEGASSTATGSHATSQTHSPFFASPPSTKASADSSSASGASHPFHLLGQLQRHSESYSSDASTSISPAASGSRIIPLPTVDPITLTRTEGTLVHHYVEYLGRWLDCTDASRQFTLRIPTLVKHCPILLGAVIAFAARHSQDTLFADMAYQRCINLLIQRLNLNSAMHDESLLCAIVILRFYEQLNGKSPLHILFTGSDPEQHLNGTSAILRASQGHTVDLSAPTLRDAAFWVYVRQCLYTATVNQQPPNIDFNLRLHPIPPPQDASNPYSEVRRETAWANNMTWLCASVIHFCFDGIEVDPSERLRQSSVLWDSVKSWRANRPSTFDPIWEHPFGEESVFPETLFTADWHVLAHVLYHFSCLLLIIYQPGPKFAMRPGNVNSKNTATDALLDHARVICGSCKGSPATVPRTTLCHTIFIWGPLMTDPDEQKEVIGILAYLETTDAWPTTWIINALKSEWGMMED
ncbi:hypothetical protein K504DRAFT_518292 [Pleomassaria siparia CBS 279.74]|uniref:Zn(2)-C6 fungal-type domain-containing protein n=1 Tax=Pleomassaria siparia CBS 279.74 TaxID=1314801 RepID=A0A6G1KNH4_9PLEO|nr:hypothetical protein K504DRAFT_518292 [Pleomassaria siparia CBS 279.74]